MDSVASNNASVTQINESSTSNAPNFESTESVIDSFDYSPFKKHLVISPKLIIARKETKVKSRTPNAVSGDAFTKYATQVQADKQRKIIEKEERKRKREEDKRLKASLPKKTRITAKRKLIIENSMSETETDDETQITYDDSSESELQEDISSCFACLSNEQWNIPEAWIGCSGKKCKRWFHKNCVSIEVTQMTK